MPKPNSGRTETGQRLHFLIPEDLYSKLSLYLLDPRTGKPRYGSITTIIESLLRALMAEVERPGANPHEIFLKVGVDIQPSLKQNLKQKETHQEAQDR